MIVKTKNKPIDRMQTHDIDSRDRTPWRCTSRLLGACMILFSIGVLAPVSVAQDATLTGEWTYKRDAKEESQREEVIDQATQGMNVLIRGRARDMLRTKTKPAPNLRFTDEGDRVILVQGDQRVSLPTDKSPTRVNSEQGVATIRAYRHQGKLIVASESQNGLRTVRYQTSEHGSRLILETSISVKQIRTPIRYRTTYHKTPTR